MTYDEALKIINNTNKFGIKPGLSRIKKLLSLLGNPQNNLKFIHVAGTNGKGSTCKMINSVLINAGFKVGLFTSPFIVDFRERIKINNKMISKIELTELVEFIAPLIYSLNKNGITITEFELITAIAFTYFSNCNCDIVILEVGLGGRFDATNVIKTPIASVITSISLDHTNILGNTIEKIAFEKAGIIKPNGTTVLYPDLPQKAKTVISKFAKLNNNKIINSNINDVNIDTNVQNINSTKLIYNNNEIPFNLIGEHQIKNAITAINTLKVINEHEFPISINNIKNGFKKLNIEARCEILSRKPFILLDGAHNTESAIALKNVIKNNIHNKPIVGIIGMLHDKDIKTFVSYVVPLFSYTICVPINNNRALNNKNLNNITKKYCENSIYENNLIVALKQAIKLSGPNGAVIICGSLYLASEIRPIIINYLNK